MNTLGCISVSTVALALAAAPASAAFVDFNTPGDLAAHFNIPAGTTSAQTFTENASGGVGNSASVRPRDSDATAVYKTETYGLAIGETFATSMFVHKVNATAGTSRMLQLGLGETTTDLFTTAAGDFLSARVDTTPDSDPGKLQLALQHRSNGSLATANQGASFTLDGARLYKFTVEIARTGATAYTIGATLVDYGTDGQTPGATVASFAPIAVTNALQNGDPALYTGFRSGYNAGAHRLDDFSAGIVPEPAALGLLTLGGLLALGRGR